jgi:UDP-2,3-diacylglucosamine hydrolase
VLRTPCHIIGDAHLGIAPPDAEQSLLRYLKTLPDHAQSLVIMGDLFDFWFAWKHVMPTNGYRVLAALADLTERGVEVLWLGGNHDCWGGESLARLTGATYSLEAWTGAIGAWRVHLAHGDGLREREDAKYRRLRTVLRNPLAIRAYGWLHPDHATRLALASSRTSRHRRAHDEGRGLMAVAADLVARDPSIELVVHGHSHVPMLEQLGSAVYANAGAWYLDRQFLVLDDERITRFAWSESGERHEIDRADRVTQKPSAHRKDAIGGI